jgi:UDP-N-acetylglucosamine 2-epimerase (non-hydrolysing)/GDP/UDP-N,N'-diacetylbacillosamine 2-epimerase (hydrolysing)
VVTVGRSDFGLYLPLLKRLASAPEMKCELIVGGAHLLPEFGMTVREVEASGFPIADRIEMLESCDTPEAIARSMGRGTVRFAESFGRFRPDILVLLGDRFEMHAAAVAAQPFLIPIAHIAGGAITTGAIDDSLRHSMTKMSHLHFVETELYAKRLMRMGEEPWRITVSGSLSVDNFQQVTPLSREDFEERYSIPLSDAPLIVTYHPVTRDHEATAAHCDELLAAIEKSRLPVVFTLPNADTSGRIIMKKVEAFVSKSARAYLVPNLGTLGYFTLMRFARAMVGNSSSGIIEAASFRLPVVNVGMRQHGRFAQENVIHVGNQCDEICAGIQKAVSAEFRAGLAGLKNAYGDGHAAERIGNVLKDVVLDAKLLNKAFYE